jgi:hypothetical protein
MHQHDPYNNNMPFLTFPSTWEIQPTPQFGDSYWRFKVRRKGSFANPVSVYLDTIDSLGSMGVPYWEIYPYSDGDVRRFYLGEERQLLNALRIAIKAQERNF